MVTTKPAAEAGGNESDDIIATPGTELTPLANRVSKRLHRRSRIQVDVFSLGLDLVLESPEIIDNRPVHVFCDTCGMKALIDVAFGNIKMTRQRCLSALPCFTAHRGCDHARVHPKR